MNNNPLVSIIIPVYNGEKYMREAIDSALSQTYKNIEVIIVNDGSADGGKTEEIALSYGDRIRYFYKENGGVSSALNVGIKNMSGEYFSWLSHDDVYSPDKIEKQLSYIKDDKTLVLCSTRFIDKNSQPIVHHTNNNTQSMLSWEEAVMYITKNGANGCAFLIPKKVFDIVGGFDESLRYCQDILMWWNIFLAHYSLQLTEDVGVLTRVHEEQVTHLRYDLYHNDANYIGDIIPQKMASMRQGDNSCLYQYAKQESIHGNFNVVKKCVSAAKRHTRFSCCQRIVLFVLSLYGRIRPLIRSMYYAIVRKI